MSLHRDAETLRLANRLLAFCLAMSIWVPVFGGIYAAFQAVYCTIIIVLAGVSLVFVPILQRVTGSPTLAGNVIGLLACLTYGGLAYFTGGLRAPATFWFVSVPVLVILLAGLRSGVFWSLVSMTVFGVFYVATEQGYSFPIELSDEGMRFLDFTALVGILLCIFLLTCVFRSLEKQARDALELALERAKAADRAKSEFLANMSHEIRTPMTAILGYADLLLDGGLERRGALEALRTVQRNGEHLLQIINDILDLSKIEAGKLEVEKLPCSPAQLVSEVAALLQIRARAKDLTFAIEYASLVPEAVETDPTRLRQILINIVGNAIKFTQAGQIRLRVWYDHDEPENPRLHFEVVDTGIGMSPDQLEKLFEWFSQGDTSTTRRFGGTGLGLAISKRLAEMLGGSIAVRSRLGDGTVASLTVRVGRIAGAALVTPARHAAETPVPDEGPSVFDEKQSLTAAASELRCRVLLAEDGPDNQRLISHVLRKAGAEVLVAENGLMAVELALAHRDAGMPFDVILMDMQMPVLDGYAATSRLRRENYSGPIVALTANAMATDQKKCLDAGCDSYTTKPINRAALIDLVRQLAGSSPARSVS